MREDGSYAISDKVPLGKAITYSIQHLMAFVGGGAIVPALIMGARSCACGILHWLGHYHLFAVHAK